MHQNALRLVHYCQEFCTIMKAPTHDGEQLEKMVKEAGVKVGAFGKLMGVGRNTPNRWFDVPRHDDSLLIRSAKLLNKEVGEYIPRLRDAAQPLHKDAPFSTSEPRAAYGTSAPSALPDCQRQLAATQAKLIETLEQYNRLLVEHNQVLRNLSNLPPNGGMLLGGLTTAHPLHSNHATP